MADERPDTESPLKWAGGKRWLIATLRDMFNVHQSVHGPTRLVDPFCGGLSLPLGIKPERCLISDANPHLMNFWRHLQHGLSWDDNCGIALENDSMVYYENRSKFNALCTAREYWTREGALLFYYLNRTCFNGLCRFNSSGYFNVPFGRYKTINYKVNFQIYAHAMKDWELYIGDFGTLPTIPGDFIYADPPYDVEFTQFTTRDFTWGDQERLAVWLSKHRGPVVASNQATPRIIDLYTRLGFAIEKISAPRTISSTGDRTPAVEILATKFV